MMRQLFFAVSLSSLAEKVHDIVVVPEKTPEKDPAGQALSKHRFDLIYAHEYQGRIHDRSAGRGKDMIRRNHRQWQMTGFSLVSGLGDGNADVGSRDLRFKSLTGATKCDKGHTQGLEVPMPKHLEGSHQLNINGKEW